MKIVKNFFIPIFAVILLIIGFVKINIINTESLSPLGNTDDNFKVVSEEFGEDFQNLLKIIVCKNLCWRKEMIIWQL